MPVHRGMGGAFIGTRLTGQNACVQLSLHDRRVRLGLARQQARGGPADFGAVQIRPNAADELVNMFGFPETGVGARSADFFAH